MDHADVYIYDVACVWRFLWYRARLDVRRTVRVRIVFTNGTIYETQCEHWGPTGSEDILKAIYRTLKEFAKQSRILTA